MYSRTTSHNTRKTYAHARTHFSFYMYLVIIHTLTYDYIYCIIYNFEFHLQTYISRYSLIPFKFTGIANVFIVVTRQKYENTLSK